jgi:amino acid adenylation domain-containing protein
MYSNTQQLTNMTDPVAIIGAGCRFPGAPDLDSFWQLLKEGKCATGKMSEDRWKLVRQESSNTHDSSRFGGLVDGISDFDFRFFGITRREGRLMDPQQRMLMEVSWEALEHAGVSLQSLQHFDTGVFVGISTFDYSLIQSFDEINEAHLGTGNALSIAANRLSYFYNLHGPSMAVDTACSSSLVALYLAVDNICSNRCSLAIVGGANALLNLRFNDTFSKAGLLSADGKCKSFDAAADGYVRGEGCGVVILKRLSEALKDGDRILATIRAAGINQDGRSNGITAPNGLAQERLLQNIYSSTHLEGRVPDYIETHGTGTPLGDPIEFHALNKTFRLLNRDPKQRCLIGSVKTNIGHLEATAGIAGLIKTALSIYYKTIPPSLHFKNPNQALNYQNACLEVCTANTKWPVAGSSSGLPLAGVSSFGFGGTNAHVVIEGVPEQQKVSASNGSVRKFPFVISAHTKDALKARMSGLGQFLKSNNSFSLKELAAYLAHRRSSLGHRFACLTDDKDDLIVLLEGAEKADLPAWKGERKPLGAETLVFVFSGQDAHYAGMGKPMAAAFPDFKSMLNECAGIVTKCDGPDILKELGITGEIPGKLPSQPAFVAYQISLAFVLKNMGIVPEAVIGHSLGEIAAAYAAGVFSLDDALRLAVIRDKLMSCPEAEGSMMACLMSPEEVNIHLRRWPNTIDIASENGPEITVVSGKSEEIEHLAGLLPSHSSIPLAGNQAFHNAAMDQASEKLRTSISWLMPDECNISFYSTCEAAELEGHELTAAYWSRQLRNKVRFGQTVSQLQKDGFSTFLEVGARPVLKKALLASLGEKPVQVLETMNRRFTALENMARLASALFVTGHNIKWDSLVSEQHTASIILPCYPWQRETLWSVAQGKQSIASRQLENNEDNHAQALNMNRESILNDLRQSVAKIIGSRPEEIDTSAPFIEMGADSILLAQAAHGIQSRFNVRISLRQFFEELSNLDSLADFLTEHGCNIKAAKPKVTEQRPVASPDQDVKEIINRQLDILSEVMNRQMELLGAGADKMPPRAVSVPSLPNVEKSRGKQNFGPYRPPGVARMGDHLTEEQQRHLNELTKKLNVKTAESKKRAAEARTRFADCRASAGFRPSVKEMLYPIEIAHASGCKLTDIDGNNYIDISMDFGVNLFGHKPEFLVKSWHEQIEKGLSLSGRSPHASEVANLLCDITGMDRCVFCQSGTEAVMVSARLARLATGRKRIAYFTDSYHGHFDGFLALPDINGKQPIPAAPGIPAEMLKDALVLKYGSEESLEILNREADSLAAVLVEPVQSRRPDLQPVEFLRELRKITTEAGSVLVFDEMITGFRVHPGGAQAHFGVRADLATYGKVLGGGQPIAAIAGSSHLLDGLDGGQWHYGDNSFPAAVTTFFAGTFTGNPLALASARAFLNQIRQAGPELQEKLNSLTKELSDDLNMWFEQEEIPIRIVWFGSLFRFAFTGNLDLLFYHLLEKGIFIWEGRNCFLSAAHTRDELRTVGQAVRESCEELRGSGFITSKLPKKRKGEDKGPDTVPSTKAQRQLWMLSHIDLLANCAYSESILIHVQGKLDTDILRRALDFAVKRHESLRTTFSDDGRTQLIHPTMLVPFHLVDASMLTGAEQETAKEAFLDEVTGQPFDLKDGPLVQMGLCRLSQDTQLIAITGHHIILDGWSFNLLINDLAVFYSAELGQTPYPKDEPPQFREYAGWLNDFQASSEMERQRGFWSEKLKAPLPKLELPYDLPVSAKWSWEGARMSRRISPSLRKGLETVGHGVGATLFMTLVTAFQSYLHRLIGQEDLLIGTPVLGRSMPGSLKIIGYLAHIVPVRSRFDAEEPFNDFLSRQKRELLDIFENQTLPFADLLRQSETGWSPDEPALVHATFNIDRPREGVRLHGLKCELLSPKVQAAKFALNVNITDLSGELLLELDYNTKLLSKNLAASICDSFIDWLRKICAHSEIPLGKLPLGQLPLLKPLLLSTNYPEPFNADSLAEVFLRIASKHRDDVAVVAATRGEESPQTITYGELNKRSDALAARLVREGIRPGEVVGIRCCRGLPRIIGMLGIIKTGAVYLPVDTELPDKRVDLIMNQTKTRFLVTESDDTVARWKSFSFSALSALQEHSKQMPELCQVNRNDLAYVMFTSGSTGEPKGVAVTHGNVLSLLAALHLRGNAPDGPQLHHSPASFDASTMQVWWPLLTGRKLVLAPPGSLSLRDIGNLIETFGVEDTFFPTGLFNLLVVHESKALSRMKRIITGGSALYSKYCRIFLEKCPDTVLENGYGPTESTVFSTLHVVTQEDVIRDSIPIGRTLSNLHGFILDKCLQPVPVNIPGELYLSGHGVATGYFNRPDLTEKSFIENPFSNDPDDKLYKTGDIVKMRPDGLLEFLSRRDSQIKLRGVRIELEEIETTLRRHPDVTDAIANVVQLDGDDSRLIAYVVQGNQTINVEHLEYWLSEFLPGYMMPDHFQPIDQIPLNANGKPERSLLPEPEGLQTGCADRVDESWTETEEKIRSTWERILKCSVPSRASNFFELGGHSLLLTEMVAEITQTFSVPLTLREAMDHHTIDSLAKILETKLAQGSRNTPIPRVSRNARRVISERNENN